MKLIRKTVGIIALMSAMVACTYTVKEEQSNKEGKEYTSAYVCPMHCEGSGSDSAGNCPVCNMEYVKNETNNK